MTGRLQEAHQTSPGAFSFERMASALPESACFWAASDMRRLLLLERPALMRMSVSNFLNLVSEFLRLSLTVVSRDTYCLRMKIFWFLSFSTSALRVSDSCSYFCNAFISRFSVT